jgi:hypothetical protein
VRVVVTLIGQDGTMRSRMVETAASGDTGAWEELLARALAAVPAYRAVPGGPVCHLRVDDQVALVAGHDLSGPLYDWLPPCWPSARRHIDPVAGQPPTCWS